MPIDRYRSAPTPDPSVTEAAIDAIAPDQLRALIRDIIPWLDGPTHARLVNGLVDRAARNTPEWAPPTPTAQAIDEIVSFANVAIRIGHADPAAVDHYLRQGSNAFLARDYPAAAAILGALLPPLDRGQIDLGQHEMLDEVLGVSLIDCVTQYVVAVYMIGSIQSRAETVLAAIDEIRGFGGFSQPLRQMERIAIEKLPHFERFVRDWCALIEARARRERQSERDSDVDRWQREVVERLEGADGLARIGRSTKRADDLRAWCELLVAAKNWKRALSAHEEAAAIVSNKPQSVGEFLDGAALAAQELGHGDLPVRLGHVWRTAPSMARLCRWLGSATSKKDVLRRATDALAECPGQAARQRALLLVIVGNHHAAAEQLASAPGLGWSDSDHPGRLLFGLFSSLFVGTRFDAASARSFEELLATSKLDEPRLAEPDVASIIELAGVTVPRSDESREAVLSAMRKAAENRIAAVIEEKRRRHYAHAAKLAVTCSKIDSVAGSAWITSIRRKYNRYPALQRELAKR